MHIEDAMTLVQLRHLIELAVNGSFSQSAIKLHLTQPALSRSIKALEDELGQPLFDRVGRKNELTVFGVHIVQRARVLVDEANELRQTSEQQRMVLRKGTHAAIHGQRMLPHYARSSFREQDQSAFVRLLPFPRGGWEG